MAKSKTNIDQYDSPWKEALEEYFEASMSFFFPTIHAEIDWAKNYRFLDKELEKVVRQAVVTEQHVDKLVQVYRLTGEKSWVIVHIDVQSQHETDFSKRMFQYHYRLFDRYNMPVATLVIYGDDSPKWQPQKYEHELWGSKATFEFSSVKLFNYLPSELEQSPNPFAVVVLAHLYTKATKNNPHDRYDLKLRLTRLLYERGYNKEQILSLYRYIDWLMALPQELEERLDQQIATDEEARTMTYVTSMERFGYKRGVEAGLQEGRQVGLQEGLQEGLQAGLQVGELQTLRDSVLDILQIRFGELEAMLIERLKQVDKAVTLRQLRRQAVVVPAIADFEAELNRLTQA